MSRWRLKPITAERVDVYVMSPVFGEVLVGSLWLSAEDLAELTGALDAVRA
jgi:hypothetical protein